MRIKAILGGVALLARPSGASSSIDSARAVVEESCQLCHNDTSLAGNMSLDAFDLSAPEAAAELAEKMVRKLRAGMMPPAGVPRPPEEDLAALAAHLETRLDENAAANPNPGRRTFQRLNRAEYEGSIRDLLALDIEAGDYLPPDTKSANFDNIADAQMLSATLLEGYLRGASELSRLSPLHELLAPESDTKRSTRRRTASRMPGSRGLLTTPARTG